MSYTFGIELAAFQLEMAKKLEHHNNKGHWSLLSIPAMRRRINQELKELDEAIMNNESPENVKAECADVANFAMFIADQYRQAD